MIDTQSPFKKRLDDYIRWIQSEKFCNREYEIPWIDIDLEMYTIFDEYKIDNLSQSFMKKSNTYRYLLSLVPTTDDSSTTYIADIEKFLKILGDWQTQLRNNLCSRYCIQYIRKGAYNCTVKPIGYMAVYFLKDVDWSNCNTEEDYFNVLKQCVRYDFKTSSGVKESIMNYRRKYREALDIFVKSLRDSLNKAQTDTVDTVKKGGNVMYGQVI